MFNCNDEFRIKNDELFISHPVLVRRAIFVLIFTVFETAFETVLRLTWVYFDEQTLFSKLVLMLGKLLTVSKNDEFCIKTQELCI